MMIRFDVTIVDSGCRGKSRIRFYRALIATCIRVRGAT